MRIQSKIKGWKGAMQRASLWETASPWRKAAESSPSLFWSLCSEIRRGGEVDLPFQIAHNSSPFWQLRALLTARNTFFSETAAVMTYDSHILHGARWLVDRFRCLAPDWSVLRYRKRRSAFVESFFRKSLINVGVGTDSICTGARPTTFSAHTDTYGQIRPVQMRLATENYGRFRLNDDDVSER